MKPEAEIIISSAYENENVIKLLVGDSWGKSKKNV
jgi:hypothetical protein